MIKISSKDRKILLQYHEEDAEEKFISSIYAFLAKCARETYVGEDIPAAPKCCKGSKKRSIEEFYYAL